MKATTVGKPIAPATGPGSVGSGPARRWIRLGVVAVLAALLVGVDLGGAPLLDPDEARHAEAAREILERGGGVEPLLNYEPYRHKPSLFYMLVGATFRMFGETETAARLVPALSVWLTLIVVYLAASRDGVYRALSAVLYLAASGFFVLVGRFTNFDGLLTASLTMGAAAFARWLDRRDLQSPAPAVPARDDAWLLDIAYASVGVATLVKGPVALVLLAAPVLVMVALQRVGLRELRPVRGAIIVVAIVACWLVPAAVTAPEYVREFLWVHNVQRFLGGSSVFHPEPFWFFVPIIAAALLPWSLMLPRAMAAATRRSSADLFLVLYALWVVLFFSMSSGKLATYVLPAFPAAALLVARWIPRSADARPWEGRAACLIAAAAMAATTPVALGVLGVFARAEIAVAFVFVPVSAAGFYVLTGARRGTGPASSGDAMAWLCGGAVASILILNATCGAALGRWSSDRDLALAALERGIAEPVIAYRVQPYSFLFYTKRPMRILYGAQSVDGIDGHDRELILSKPRRLDELRERLAGREIEVIASNARHLLIVSSPVDGADDMPDDPVR